MSSEPLEVRGSDYWAAYVGEEKGQKIKTDGLKRHTGSNDITH